MQGVKVLVDILVLEPDLLFSSKLESAAKRLGASIKIVASPQEVQKDLGMATPKALLVNLDFVGRQPEFLSKLVREKSCRIIGYYSHVNKPLAEDARQIGINIVITRGELVGKLDDTISRQLSGG
jgi:hypothetical protein